MKKNNLFRLRKEFIEEVDNDSIFNQDIDYNYNRGIRSPGWARLQNKKKNK